MQFAAGDYGMTAISTCVFSAAVATGVVALQMFFPLVWLPGIAANVYIERSSTVQIDGLIELAQSSSQVLGCLTGFIQANTTSSGQLGVFLRTCQG
jgi:hypothetical protein